MTEPELRPGLPDSQTGALSLVYTVSCLELDRMPKLLGLSTIGVVSPFMGPLNLLTATHPPSILVSTLQGLK